MTFGESQMFWARPDCPKKSILAMQRHIHTVWRGGGGIMVSEPLARAMVHCAMCGSQVSRVGLLKPPARNRATWSPPGIGLNSNTNSFVS